MAERDEDMRSAHSSGGMLLATSGPYTPRMFSVPPSGGLIGRSRKCRISLLHDCEVSHNHAVIEPAQGGFLCIRDVGSTFGTFLNEKRLSEPKRASEPNKLKAYDSIKVGQTSLRWRPIELIEAAVAVAIIRSGGSFDLVTLHGAVVDRTRWTFPRRSPRRRERRAGSGTRCAARDTGLRRARPIF